MGCRSFLYPLAALLLVAAPFPAASGQSTLEILRGRVTAADREEPVEGAVVTAGVPTAAWIGDEWRASSALQLQLGLRLDAPHPSLVPEYTPRVVEQIYGLRTDVVPRTAGFSPRLRFSWVSRARQ